MTTANWIILIGGVINLSLSFGMAYVAIGDWKIKRLRKYIAGVAIMAVATLILWIKVFIEKWEW